MKRLLAVALIVVIATMATAIPVFAISGGGSAPSSDIPTFLSDSPSYGWDLKYASKVSGDSHSGAGCSKVY